jgi:iron complex transport system permease protein
VSAVAASRVRRRRRAGSLTAILLAALVLLVVASLSIGAYPVSLPQLVAALTGNAADGAEFIVLQLRLPRTTLALLVGIAFGLSGAIFQSLLGNPLASPDIIGISGGASAAAVGAILLLGLSGTTVAAAAFAGALAAAALIFLLSWRAGLTGYRFVLVGVAVAFLVEAVLGYLLTRADVRDAQAALVWLVGSLSGARWEDIGVLAASLTLLIPATAVLARALSVLQLGDQTAIGLGLGVQRSRVALLATAVGLAAVATAAAGPVAFVAFVSAPIARRLVGTGGLALVPSALVGAILVLSSDLVAQHALPGGLQVPVGIITGAVGAPYLLWLLARVNRREGVA